MYTFAVSAEAVRVPHGKMRQSGGAGVDMTDPDKVRNGPFLPRATFHSFLLYTNTPLQLNQKHPLPIMSSDL